LRLSVIIPVYNERHTLGVVLATVCSVLPSVDKQIVIVDDFSTDGTREWLKENFPCGDRSGLVTGIDGSGMLEMREEEALSAVRLLTLFHERNRGKGGAIQTALAAVSGDVVVIQDADLEYDPHDWAPMYDLIATRKIADVVYGSRFYGRPHRSLYFHHFIGNKLISFLFSMLYNQTLTDVEVCYKMFTRQVADELKIACNDFGFEIEISAKISLRRKWRIYELGISYFGRTYAEGKKINWKDGVKALWYLVKFRIGG
jgi:glycosyltransferase involved in cell wall biosynthesis